MPLKDKFGVSWQIVPGELVFMLRDGDPIKSRRAMEAMMKMVELDVVTLRKAFEGTL